MTTENTHLAWEVIQPMWCSWCKAKIPLSIKKASLNSTENISIGINLNCLIIKLYADVYNRTWKFLLVCAVLLSLLFPEATVYFVHFHVLPVLHPFVQMYIHFLKIVTIFLWLFCPCEVFTEVWGKETWFGFRFQLGH